MAIKHSIPSDPRFIDLTGKRFSRWKVLNYFGQTKHHHDSLWLCRCNCGTTRVVLGNSLRHNTSKSCGCFNREQISRRFKIHGMHGTPEYRSWQSMKNRCYRTSELGYQNYGGRGIKVCRRWLNSFVAFFMDMGPKPSPKHSLDRVDNDGPYCPRNCRWETRKQQARNTRKNRRLTYNNCTLTLPEWAERFGINGGTIRSRLRLGWSVHRTLSTPVKSSGK